MLVTAIKTKILLPPKDNLLTAIQEALPSMQENSILAITSKVVSIHEGRCVKVGKVPHEDVLAKEEAEYYIPRGALKGRRVLHTIAQGMIIPSAGIDTFHGYHILWPRNPQKSAQTLWHWVRKIYQVKKIGILIVDSHSIPFRRGTVGISLGYCGFKPLNEYYGKPGLFKEPLGTGTVANIADVLASAATFVMGEGGEQTPVALITNIPQLTFTTNSKTSRISFRVSLKDDIYAPLLQQLPWEKRGVKV